jgi:hypothetical protein
METICQVAFNLMTHDEATKAEQILREYLLGACQQVCMTRTESSYLSLFHIIPHTGKIKKFMNQLAPEDIAEKGEHFWTFNTTENIKNLFNEATLLGISKIFYGFADPKFFSNGNEIAEMISTDRLLTLHISDSDKAELANKGVYLDSPEI